MLFDCLNTAIQGAFFLPNWRLRLSNSTCTVVFFFADLALKSLALTVVVKFSPPPEFHRGLLDRSPLAAPLPERVCWTGQIPGGD